MTSWGLSFQALDRSPEIPLGQQCIGVVSCRKLLDSPRTVCLDAKRGRLHVADGFGVYSCRTRSLLDADCEIDCKAEGYSDFAGHVRSVRCLRGSRDGRWVFD